MGVMDLWSYGSRTPHIAQNTTDTYRKYFQYFIAIEILSQRFRQILQNISSKITILTF